MRGRRTRHERPARAVAGTARPALDGLGLVLDGEREVQEGTRASLPMNSLPKCSRYGEAEAPGEGAKCGLNRIDRDSGRETCTPCPGNGSLVRLAVFMGLAQEPGEQKRAVATPHRSGPGETLEVDLPTAFTRVPGRSFSASRPFDRATPDSRAPASGTIEGQIKFRRQADGLLQFDASTRAREIAHCAFDPGVTHKPNDTIRINPVPSTRSPLIAQIHRTALTGLKSGV
jgi:hypothetical protein